ncbi:RRP12-like protein [Punica granatum]|uniref:RRP12-like protein n=1 Tax=Punica granatum TaxID=22663 RepID=A0A6P8CVY7_PUNGR|nr:RRP12-like protein [Punica granatum]
MQPPRKRARQDGQDAEMPPELEDRPEELFKDGSDICQQLMDRYAKSSAPQHRHLIATAAATRAILSAESLPFTPSSYFAAAMANLENASSSTKALSSTETAALMSFLVIVIAAVPPRGIVTPRAREAVEVLVRLVGKQDGEETLGVSTVRSAVKCLGILLGFCDVEDWNSVNLGFETLLKFSVDKRPKVRRCAQECLENSFKLLRSPAAVKKASKLVISSFKNYIPLADTLSSTPVADEPKDESPSKSEHVEVLHMLNVVRFTLPSLSAEARLKIFLEVHKFMSSQFSILTRHILKIIEAFLEIPKAGDALQESEDIIVSLCSYVSSNGNPVDTVISAANLLKAAMDKLQIEGSELRMKNLPTVCRSLAGLLTSESDTASQASHIFKELITHHIDEKTLPNDSQLSEGEDESTWSSEARAGKAMCAALDNVLETCKGIPNEHILAIISALFLKLGGCSYTCMKSILFKLADLMIHGSGDASGTDLLRRCIGSAVIAIGPEKMLTLFPISLHDKDFSYTNFWLVPILKDHVIGSSLNYYMEHIVPLAKSFQQASRKVGKSELGKDLKNRAHDLWKLLTAFCRHPADTYKQFPRLAELLAALLRKYAFIRESVALALKVLVNENRSILGSKKGLEQSTFSDEFMVEFQNLQPHSTKTATKNMKALSSSSIELLQILSDLFINSFPGKRSLLKDAIGCLACIVDSSVTKEIFTSSLKKFDFLTSGGELQRLTDSDALPDDEQGVMIPSEKYRKRFVIMELASCFVEGANQELIESIFDFVKQTFQETNDLGHGEAYHALRKILEEHEWFRSSHYGELLDVLLCLKTPTDATILNGRFACFHILMVHTLEMNLEEENSKAFLILNEIILTLKDAKEEARKEAYDILLVISSSLRNRSSVISDSLYHKLISMIMGYLSGSSPHITSGAVSALSVMLYKDTDMCLSVPDLVPSILSLLQSKAVEVVKAVLGFVKVLVSCMPTKDLQNLLNEVVPSIIPWSSVSRHHFRSKVTVILEIIIRKCGFAAIGSVIPEKYKGFLKTVSENRNNKTSKETGTGDTETASADLRTSGPQKRRHNKLGHSREGDGLVEHKRRKRERKDDNNTLHSKVSRGGAPRGFEKVGNNESGRSGNRNFRGAISGQNGKRKPGDMHKKQQLEGKGKGKGLPASISHKRKKFGRNQQKK